MIARLRGKVVEISNDSAVIDIQGVGYEVTLTSHGMNLLQMNHETTLLAYTHVREDALQLFAFINSLEKQLFLSLIKINGIGPRMAIHMMSGASCEKIIQMIENEDAKALSQLPRVGKKTAEQMILSLKGKIVHVETPSTRKAPLNREIISALINLGFRPADVEKAVSRLPEGIDLQEGVRQGLLSLTTL